MTFCCDAVHSNMYFSMGNKEPCSNIKCNLLLLQESRAIAKTTARCAQYMGALKNFESPH